MLVTGLMFYHVQHVEDGVENSVWQDFNEMCTITFVCAPGQ